MNELIPVKQNDDGSVAVSGRELHDFLEVGTRYDTWINRMFEYGFEENQDYILDVQKRATNNPKNPITTITNHIVNLDMAKEISMIQRTDKGKEARRYFLQVENFWNSPEMITKRAMQILTNNVEQLKIENAELQPKALFSDAVRGSVNSCLVKDLSVLLKQNGVDIGQNRLFKYLRKKRFIGKGKAHYNKPTQKALDQGLLEYREHFRTNSVGEVVTHFTPLVTGKGQQYFINKFLQQDIA